MSVVETPGVYGGSMTWPPHVAMSRIASDLHAITPSHITYHTWRERAKMIQRVGIGSGSSGSGSARGSARDLLLYCIDEGSAQSEPCTINSGLSASSGVE